MIKKAQSPTFHDFVDAAIFDQSKANQMLQENPNWINETSCADETALHYVVVENYLDAARYLLSKGADVNGAQEFGTPLTDAITLGYPGMTALLIEHGANLEMRDIGDLTPLLLAAQNGYAEICHLLLRAGADIYARDDSDRSVLDVAFPPKQKHIALLLARYGYRTQR